MITERRIDITIPSTYDDIGLVRKALACVQDEVPLPRELMLKVEICVVEAIGNSIRHALDLKPDRSVHIALRLLQDRFVVEVSDCGRVMPAEAQNRLEASPPANSKPKLDARAASSKTARSAS